MPSGNKKLLRFLQSWIINTVAVLLTVIILPGQIHYDGKWYNLLIVSFLLGVLNAFVRPVLMLLALPLIFFTLGLFMLVINALLLELLTLLLPFFHVHSFWSAFLGAIIISFISLILNAITGGNTRVTFNRQQRPPDDKGPGGNGPVIDV